MKGKRERVVAFVPFAAFNSHGEGRGTGIKQQLAS